MAYRQTIQLFGSKGRLHEFFTRPALPTGSAEGMMRAQQALQGPKKETTMRNLVWKGVLAAAIFSIGLSGPAKAQNGDNDGCSNATLRGDYSFTIHGESIGVLVPQTTGVPKLVPFPNPLPIDGVAITHFDGKTNPDGTGGLTQIDFVIRNGISLATPTTPVTSNGFRSEETGTYTVNQDCTGTFKIMFPDTSEIDVAFVLANHGREIRTVVTRQHVPPLPPPAIPAGATCDATSGGCDLGTQTRSDGVKIGSVWNTDSYNWD
jgi:hypothetical protein